jgi:hypothetical protein
MPSPPDPSARGQGTHQTAQTSPASPKRRSGRPSRPTPTLPSPVGHYTDVALHAQLASPPIAAQSDRPLCHSNALQVLSLCRDRGHCVAKRQKVLNQPGIPQRRFTHKNTMGPPVNTNPAGLPVSNSMLSFWQQTTRSFPYLNVNKTEPVPERSNCVIIGSGIVSRPLYMAKGQV